MFFILRFGLLVATLHILIFNHSSMTYGCTTSCKLSIKLQKNKEHLVQLKLTSSHAPGMKFMISYNLLLTLFQMSVWFRILYNSAITSYQENYLLINLLIEE